MKTSERQWECPVVVGWRQGLRLVLELASTGKANPGPRGSTYSQNLKGYVNVVFQATRGIEL